MDYTVTYTFTNTTSGETQLITAEFDNELSAVRKISSVGLYTNMELVCYSDNIDVTAYRF